MQHCSQTRETDKSVAHASTLNHLCVCGVFVVKSWRVVALFVVVFTEYILVLVKDDRKATKVAKIQRDLALLPIVLDWREPFGSRKNPNVNNNQK